MDTTQAVQSCLALGVAVLVPWLMQLLKSMFPTLICGKKMKRALVFLFSAGSLVGIMRWTGTLQPTPESLTALAMGTLSLFFAVEGAYRYMLRQEADGENTGDLN